MRESEVTSSSASRHRDALGEVAGGDRGGGVLDPRQRAEGAADGIPAEDERPRRATSVPMSRA